MLVPVEPQILRPYHRAEARSVAEAARIAGRSVRTIREWCLRHDLGRRIGGQWAVSIVALTMYLESNKEALGAYLAGDRSSPIVTEYFERYAVLVRKAVGFREEALSEPNVLPVKTDGARSEGHG
jgi:helix-turn-helix protein